MPNKSSTKLSSEKNIFFSTVIDEEPESIDSIISNPTSFPLTVVPASLTRSSTCCSSLYRQGSYR